MEGRLTKDGKDLGDRHFHEVGWGTSPDAAQEDLARIAMMEVELAERQAESLASENKNWGVSAYKGLIAIYRNHQNIDVWRKRIEDLERG